jgi:hypothetical protein
LSSVAVDFQPPALATSTSGRCFLAAFEQLAAIGGDSEAERWAVLVARLVTG